MGKIVSQAVSRTGLQATSSKSQIPSSKSSTPTDKSQTPSSKAQTPSSKSQTPSSKTQRWWCPRAGCSFVTDKAGMLNKVGAEHVKEVHGATVEMMRANVTMWKFRKEKRSK